MSVTNPRVSVCMPTYNYARYLSEAIESVLAQDFSDFELLVIDDCSTDDTRAVVQSYAASDDRVVFSVNEKNLGMVENWNLCLARARGEYVKFLFGDDILARPDALGSMVACLDSDREVSLVGSPRNLIDDDSRFLDTLSYLPSGAILPGTEIISRCLLDQRNQNLIGEPSVVMFRRVQALRGFNRQYRQLVDLEMWFHLLEQGKYAHLDKPLSSFRIHTEQQTAKNILSLAYINDLSLLFDEYLFKEYVSCGRLHKRFLVYNQFYKIWKKARQNKIDSDLVQRKIEFRYRSWEFYLLLPFYKVYNPFQKLLTIVKNFVSLRG
jgi:glycosyltransferase involved in cell wall biosynthesis